MKPLKYILSICFCLLVGMFLYAQQVEVFSVWPMEERSSAFISLSDIHQYDMETPEGILPTIVPIGEQNETTIELTGAYRKAFLEAVQLTESDKIHFIDYGKNLHFSFTISSLKTIAVLDYYISEDSWPHTSNDFMFGIEIPSRLLPGLDPMYIESFAALGTSTPFSKTKLTAIHWLPKTTDKNAIIARIPKDQTIYQEYELRPFTFGKEYTFQLGSTFYYMRELICKNTSELFARHLYVYDLTTNKLLKDRIYSEMEGISLCGISEKGVLQEYPEYQYTGKLFHNLPPVIFGFTNHSFDCPTIQLLEMDAEDVFINCDNRH